MTKLGLREREAFKKIVTQDLYAIEFKVIEQIKILWEVAREEILKERGFDLLMERKEQIKEKMKELQQELTDIERELHSEPLTVHQTLELGGSVDRWDNTRGAKFFNIPVESQLDYDIVQRIKERVDVEAPAKYLDDLARASLRELTMAGTFEEAQAIYTEFYSLDFRRYGVDIPPRLKEMADSPESTDFMMGYSEKPKLKEKNKGGDAQ